jgi:hypothetical protein
MILLITIILFIIFLIYSIKPRSEEYTLEGLKLSWKNKASIEGNVTKWIVILKDKSGTTIHKYENSDAGNLKDFTDVTMNIVDKKEFDNRIIGDNTLELYYNKVNSDTKLYTKTVTFTENDFSGAIDTNKLEEIDIPEPESYTYEFIINKTTASLGIHVEYIKLDGVLATKAQTTIHKSPNRNNKPDNMFSIGSGTENYASWNSNGYSVGNKIFTIKSDKKVDKIDIVYTRPRYAPGWIIKENGVTKITETSNRGSNMNPRPVVYTYDIKNGKSSPFTIPHQIASGADGWCVANGATVHQDVPGCGRICSDTVNVGRKDKNTWGSWNNYPGSVDCPAAKLDEVYQYLNGKRSLRVGKVSGVKVDPMKQFTTGEQLYIKGAKRNEEEERKYCADEGNTIKCNRGGIGGWEKFRFNKNSDGTYSFRGGRHNKYCADEGNTIKCNRGGIGGWEKFKIIKNNDNTYSFKGGKNNKYCADEGNKIICDRSAIGSWEKFEVGKI